MNAFIIARDTEEEAKTVLQEIIDKANIQAVHAFGDATREAVLPHWKVKATGPNRPLKI